MGVWFLGQENPLEEERATHSSILAWRIPWTEDPGGLQSMGLQSRTWLSNWACTHWLFFLSPVPKLFLSTAHTLFSIALCSRLAYNLDFALNHVRSWAHNSGFSLLKVSFRSECMAREPTFKKKTKNPPWRLLLSLAHDPAFGTLSWKRSIPVLSSLEFYHGRTVDAEFRMLKCVAWPQETEALKAFNPRE